MLISIQYCRAIAALLVVLFHASHTLALDKYFGDSASWLERMFSFGGAAGVAFFFVLSGLIIHQVHHRDIGHPSRIPVYALKRATRIYPIYWIIFIGTYLVARQSPTLSSSLPTGFAVLLKSLLLVPQNPAVVGATGAPVISVAWTLQYEMMFYLAFGLGLLHGKLFALITGFTLAFAIGILSGAINTTFGGFFHWQLILLFLMGMAVSAANIRQIGIWRSPRMATAVGAFLFMATGIYADVAQDPKLIATLDLAYGASSAIVIHSLVQQRPASSTHKTGTPPLRLLGFFGDASYALYLIHYPLVSIVCKMADRYLPHNLPSVMLAFAACLVTSAAGAAALHVGIERPLMRTFASLIRK